MFVRFNRGVPDPKIRIFDLGRKKVKHTSLETSNLPKFMMISLNMVRHDLHDYIRTRAN